MVERMKYRYRIETVTPLHIGNGEKLTPADYAVHNHTFYRVDTDSLFRDPEFQSQTNSFIKSVRQRRNFSWKQFNLKLARRHPLYTIPVDEVIRSAYNVWAFIKTANRPFLPGSSLKGYLRTVIFGLLLFHHDKDFVTAPLTKGLRQAQNAYEVSDLLERILFGADPQHDLMRGIQVGDSTPVSANAMKICETQVVQKGRSSWDHKGWREHLEVLPEGTTLKGEIVFDWPKITRALTDLAHSAVVENILHKFPEALRRFGAYKIKKEVDFYSNISLRKATAVKKFYDTLDHDPESIYMQLGQQTGWRSKTAGDPLREKNPNLFRNIISHFYDYNKGEFPKTRRLVAARRQGRFTLHQPMGWVRFTLEEF